MAAITLLNWGFSFESIWERLYRRLCHGSIPSALAWNWAGVCLSSVCPLLQLPPSSWFCHWVGQNDCCEVRKPIKILGRPPYLRFAATPYQLSPRRSANTGWSESKTNFVPFASERYYVRLVPFWLKHQRIPATFGTVNLHLALLGAVLLFVRHYNVPEGYYCLSARLGSGSAPCPATGGPSLGVGLSPPWHYSTTPLYYYWDYSGKSIAS